MHAKDVIRQTLNLNESLVTRYLGDLDDADLLIRPVEGMNHIAWQLGHLIASEKAILEPYLPPGTYPELPASLQSQAARQTSREAPEGGFLKKADYLEWAKKVRAASIAGLEKLSESDLDKPTAGPMAKFAPTVAAMIVLVANHTLMHAGQFTVVRRALNKPVLF